MKISIQTVLLFTLIQFALPQIPTTTIQCPNAYHHVYYEENVFTGAGGDEQSIILIDSPEWITVDFVLNEFWANDVILSGVPDWGGNYQVTVGIVDFNFWADTTVLSEVIELQISVYPPSCDDPESCNYDPIPCLGTNSCNCLYSVECVVDPCEVSTCSNYPDAECTADYCGGCFAEYFVDGLRVNCNEPAICYENEDCPNNSLCVAEIGDCDMTESPGFCIEQADYLCEENNIPVCGCDGNNYSNPCEANYMSFSGVNYFGECESFNCCDVAEDAIEECGGMPGCFIPSCTHDCNFEPVQCSGSTGWCWCVDENGNEIDGTAQPSWEGIPECEDFNNLDPQIGDECVDSFGYVGYLDCEYTCFPIPIFENLLEDGLCDDNGWQGPQLYCSEWGHDCGDCTSSGEWDGTDPFGLGFCAETSCLGENPAGCFQNDCEDGHTCVDFGNSDAPGFCVSGFCDCDTETGQWMCTDDCNGGTCIADDGDIGDICIADDFNGILEPGYLECDLECWETNLIEDWVDDGLCDDGGFGADFTCPEFDCDGEDCGLTFINGECIAIDDCDPEFQGTGDINQDEVVNVLDIVQTITIILSFEEPSFDEMCILDVNADEIINILDIVIIVDWILNPIESSYIINTGTSFGFCWGYCISELEINSTQATYREYSWNDHPDFPELLLEETLSEFELEEILNAFNFDYFQLLDDVYGCPDCADGGSEWIEISHEDITKRVTFEFYSSIPNHDELVVYLRDLREYFHSQLEN